MRHRLILAAATAIAVCAGTLPLAAVAVLSNNWAHESQQAQLQEYARLTLERAKRTINRAETTLALLNRESLPGCSVEHLARMRQLTLDDTTVEEIGYYRGGVLACTGWGRVDKVVEQGTPTYVLPTGSGLYFDITPEVTGAGTVLVVANGQHNALIKPERFVEVLLPEPVTIGVASADGRIFAQTGPASGTAAAARLSPENDGMDQQGIMYAEASGYGLRAFAMTDMSAMPGWLDEGRWMLIPVSLLVSGVLVGLVILLSRRQLSLRGDIVHGLQTGEFIAHYQPLIEVATGRCMGAEALVRWRQPNGKLVPPDVFIPYTEQDELILELTAAMIRRVVSDLASDLRSDPDIHVAINVSARDMEDGGFLTVLERATRDAGVDPAQIWIEATERGFINVEAARTTLDRARRAGHRVAIDDFGTGYSSLSLLEGLPLDALKIDKSFVGAIGKDAASSVVTPHIIEMAHGLRLNIVAEGVETLEQEAYLRAAGVEFAQGWLYSKALPAEQFIDYYRSHRSGRGTLPRAA